MIRHLCLRYLAKKSRYSEIKHKRRDSEDVNDNKATLRRNMNTNQMSKEIETMATSKIVIKRNGGTKM